MPDSNRLLTLSRLIGKILSQSSRKSQTSGNLPENCGHTWNKIQETNHDALANSICHAGRVLSGIHDFNKLQSWIPAKKLPE